jgi:hypothetical protein
MCVLVRCIFVQSIFEQTIREVDEINANVLKKVRLFMNQKAMFCHFLKEQVECCLNKVTACFDICLRASFKP